MKIGKRASAAQIPEILMVPGGDRNAPHSCRVWLLHDRSMGGATLVA